MAWMIKKKDIRNPEKHMVVFNEGPRVNDVVADEVSIKYRESTALVPLNHDAVEFGCDVEIVPYGQLPHPASHTRWEPLPPQLSALLVSSP